jgi:hypothetical protein
MIEPILKPDTIKVKELVNDYRSGRVVIPRISARVRLEAKQSSLAHRFHLSRIPDFLTFALAKY